VNKILQISLWVLAIALIILVLGFVNKSQEEMALKKPIINIDYETENRFVGIGDVLKEIINTNDTSLKSINNYNILEIEQKINNNPAIKEAQVYRTIDGNIIANVKQRRPIVRVYSNGENYYIDEKGFLMPTSNKYTARVLVVSGFLNESSGRGYGLNYANLPDSLIENTLLDDVYKISKYIDESEFWSAQIEQVSVNKDLDFILIPKVGNHKIVFGGVNNVDGKFNKLMIFYQKGLKRTGWNEYSEINLKYKDQVVCTKIYN
jgi:cell division protein FtsQ